MVKFIRSSGKVDTVLVGKGGWVIEAFVDKNNIAFNDKYILVDQKPLSLIPFCGAGDAVGKNVKKL